MAFLSLFQFLILLTSSYAKSSVPFLQVDNNQTFFNPVIDQLWADPFVYQHSDGFYYMSRAEMANTEIAVYKSQYLSNWRNAEYKTVYRAPQGLLNLWAPELHWVDGNFYIHFALDDGDNANHRMYVIQALDPENPLGNYTTEKRYSVFLAYT